MTVGTSAIQHTTPSPCISLSKGDSKLYTSFEVCERKNHKHLRKAHWSTNASNLCSQYAFQDKCTYIIRQCKECASGYIEHIIVKNLLKTILNYIKYVLFLYVLVMLPSSLYCIQGIWNNSNFKIFRSWMLISYIWVPYTTMEGTMKNK